VIELSNFIKYSLIGTTLITAGCAVMKSYDTSFQVKELEKRITKIEYATGNKVSKLDLFLQEAAEKAVDEDVVSEFLDRIPDNKKLDLTRKLFEKELKKKLKPTSTLYKSLENQLAKKEDE